MHPCRHLDYDEARYGETCTLVTLEHFSVQVKHWRRNNVPYEGAPVNVQFCGQGRGTHQRDFPVLQPGRDALLRAGRWGAIMNHFRRTLAAFDRDAVLLAGYVALCFAAAFAGGWMAMRMVGACL